MTENDLVAKMLDTLVKSRKELDNIDLEFTKKSLPDLDKIIEHISAPLMIMVMGEFSTGKSTFINAMVGEEVAAMNATPTTAVITKLCYGEKDKILVYYTDGTVNETENNAFKQMTAKIGTENEDKNHESITYVERQMPIDILRHMTIIDSPGLNDINEKHIATTKEFVDNADTVFWMFNALHAGKKTEVDAMDLLTPRLKPIAIINMMDEIDEEEDDPKEFLDNLRVQLKDKVQAVVGISAKYALEGKLEKNETKIEIGNLKELEQVVQELVLPNHDKFKLNTLMDELGDWIAGIATEIKNNEEKNRVNKENDYDSYLAMKGKLQQNEEVLSKIANIIKGYGIEECATFNEQAMFFVGVLHFWGICLKINKDNAEIYWERSALKNHVLVQYYLGTLYSVKSDYKKAFTWYKKSAEQDNVKAQYSLGYCYYNGKGIEEDKQEAVYWYKKSAEQGNTEAQNALGDKNAQYELALLYEAGNRVKKDNNQAFYWCQKAAEQGLASAQYMLASFYEKGIGTTINIDEAIYWYERAVNQGFQKANIEFRRLQKSQNDTHSIVRNDFDKLRRNAKHGDAAAQYELAVCCEKGNGTAKNDFQAFLWYQESAGQGYALSQCALANCYMNGIGTEKDLKQAIYWYEQAEEHGYAEAAFRLGHCYANGLGVTKNDEQAIYWYEKAANQGYQAAKSVLSVYKLRIDAEQGKAFAQNSLGDRYFFGEGVQQDFRQAVYWYEKAANQGNATAQYNLGICYRTGKGVNEDPQQAEYWFRKAASRGNKASKESLKSMKKIKNSSNSSVHASRGSGCLIPMIVFICVIGALCLL